MDWNSTTSFKSGKNDILIFVHASYVFYLPLNLLFSFISGLSPVIPGGSTREYRLGLRRKHWGLMALFSSGSSEWSLGKGIVSCLTGFKGAVLVSNRLQTFTVPLKPLKCRFQIPKNNSSKKTEKTRSGFSIRSKVYERALASSIYLTTILFFSS